MKLCPKLLVVLVLASSCYSQPRNAPFRVRPDSVVAGDLTGPFTGQVSDAVSGDPVIGAVVYTSWAYHTGSSTEQPTGFRESVTSTDTNGRYRVADVSEAKTIDGSKAQKPLGRLTDFHLVVYKRGYVAYRSDRRFHDFGPRNDFAQRLNKIALERWNSTQSHARHLRYVGGGGPLTELVNWERELASEELSGGTAGISIGSALMPMNSNNRITAAQLLGESEIKSITQFDGNFESGPLNDEANTASYSSQHFKALGQPEIFDIAVRLWRSNHETGDPAARFEELLTSLPGTSILPTTDVPIQIADRSLIAVEGDIQGISFLDQTRGIVVLITCGKGLCTEIGHLTRIAQKVFQNIEAVLPPAQNP